jgi:hypothetical protein
MIPNEQTENYNETVLIPILQNRVNDLTAQTIMLEAKLQIAAKERETLKKQLEEASQPAPTGEQNPE